MKLSELGCLAKIDRTPATDDEVLRLPFVGLEHIEKGTGNFIDDNVEVSADELLATKFRFTPSHVLYGKLRPNLNKVALPNFEGVCTTEILPLLPDPSLLDRTYLWGALLHSDFVKWASHIVQGANLPRLSPTDLAQYQIPIPDLPPAESLAEQRRITAILSAADGERRRRRYIQSAHSDRFAQDLFVEMFGDPATNPMGWDVDTIKSVVATSQYGTSEKSNDLGIGYPILGMANVTYAGNLDLSHLAYVNLSRRAYTSLRLEPGDIIFNRTNSTELVGKTAVWTFDFDAVLASYLVKLRMKPHMRSEYFCALLNTPHYKELFRRRCKKAVGQSNISPTLLQEFPLMIPPKDLQDIYAERVAGYSVARTQQSELGHQTDHLFQSLLDRAFRGEL